MAHLASIDSFADAERYLRDRAERKLGHNTLLVRRHENAIAVKYHATDVVTFHADDTRTLSTGGWLTSTTKERINQFLPMPWRVWADRGTWYIGRRGNNPGPEYIYADGVTVDGSTDTLTYPPGCDALAAENAVRADRATKRAIAAYVKGWTAETAAQCADARGGDCWHCFMVTDSGTPMGDAFSDHSHLSEHVRERYYMASLTANAITEAGYPNPALIYWHAPDLARRTLRRYLEARLLTGPSTGRRGNAAYSTGYGQ